MLRVGDLIKPDINEMVEHMTTSIIFNQDVLIASGVDPIVIDKYLHLGTKLLKKKGEYIFEIGTNIKGLYFLKKGRVKSNILGKDGNIKTFSIIEENCLVGEQFILHEQPSLYEIYVMDDAELYFFNSDKMLSIMKEDFAVNLFLIKSLAIKSRMIAIQLEDKCTRNILQVVCRVLYSICCYVEKEDNIKKDIKIQLSHQDLADIISSHRVTVTKSLSYLKKMGILDYKYENITIKKEFEYKLKEIAFDSPLT